MTTWFYPGQEDYITKLNELGAIAELVAGQDGWSPTFAVAADGTRSVLQVVDWVGGEGTKPATGKYVGSAGFVTLIADAVDIRGLKGDKGDEGDAGPANSLNIGTVVSGASASATISGTAPTQELNLVLPKGDNGMNGWSPVLAVATDGERSVLEVVDWVGGEGTKPAITGYIGATGIVVSIADAINVRGPVGAEGDTGPANSLSIGTVAEGVAAATITGTAPSQTLNLVLPKATDGTDGDDGWSPIFAAVADGERRVLQLVDWTGSTGTKPATGAYVGATGLVALAADATDIRGAEGAGGGGAGDVVGPAASVDNQVALFDGVSGKVIKGGGLLNTGAYAEQDRWKLQTFLVRAMTASAVVPSWALGSYYPQSNEVVANGHTAVRGSTGDIYTMTDGVWVLTDPFDVNSNGSRIAFAQTGDVGPYLWTRTGNITTRTAMPQGSSNIRYSEGTAGVDFANYTVRTKLNQIGRLTNLTTADKTNIVAAINELVSSKADTSSLGTSAALNVPATGNAATGEVVKGNDTRLSDSRPPTGTAGGVLSGSYPNPSFAVDMATQAELDAVSAVANSKLSDAPSDGKTYGRKDAAWAEITSGGASYQTGDSLTTSRTLSTPDWVEAGKVYLQSSYPALFALAGDSATSVFDGLSTEQAQPPAAICAASSTVLVSVGGTGTSTRSEDAGTSWARVTGPNTSDVLNAVCAPSSTVVVAVGNAGVVWRSTNAGVSWTKITGPNTTDTLRSVAALSSTALIAVGNAGVSWTSSNGGGSWTKITGPNTTDNLRSVVALSSTVAVAIDTNGAQWKTTNSGANWTRTTAATSVVLSSLCALGANTLVAVGSSNFSLTSIIRSTDAGASWTVITPINTTTNLQSVAALNSTDVIAVGYRGVIWRSEDAGATWFAVGDLDRPSRTASLTCVAATAGNLIAAAGNDPEVFTSIVWRAGGFQHDPATQFVTPYTRAAQAGMKQYIKA